MAPIGGEGRGARAARGEGYLTSLIALALLNWAAQFSGGDEISDKRSKRIKNTHKKTAW